MFSTNESTMDRLLRVVLGLVLIYAWYALWVSGVLGIIALVLGAVFLVTGIIGWCPLYTLFGMNTNRSGS